MSEIRITEIRQMNKSKTVTVTVTVAKYIAVTFALGLGARVAIKGYIKISDTMDSLLKEKLRG